MVTTTLRVQDDKLSCFDSGEASDNYVLHDLYLYSQLRGYTEQMLLYCVHGTAFIYVS